MEHLRPPKDIRKFIISNVVIYIIHVISCIQKNSGLFLILYVCWETNHEKVCQLYNALSQFPVFLMKILKAKMIIFRRLKISLHLRHVP